MIPAQLPLFAVRRSPRARRARLTLSDAGEALVVLPLGAPESIAAGLVARHLDWLLRHQQRIAAERHAFRGRPRFGLGRTLALRGTEHRVVVEQATRRRSSVQALSAAEPVIVVRLGEDAAESIAAVLERWLRAEARRDIELAVKRRSAEMALAPSSIAVRDQRTRWGSASARGTLSFSWRLVLAPADVLDYVVVHELGHLRWRGHGPRFWGLVKRHVADADGHRRWLRQNHRLLHAALADGED